VCARADSLVMADRAVAMAEAGCTSICVLGVDFMSENVRAILDAAGHTEVAVYRMDPSEIGCTLAEAAESDSYLQWLESAKGQAERNLHVVYINTSLRTKAESQCRVPTITCTSSNVVKTVLQAFAQVCCPLHRCCCSGDSAQPAAKGVAVLFLVQVVMAFSLLYRGGTSWSLYQTTVA
jgi:quinolinate synthase